MTRRERWDALWHRLGGTPRPEALGQLEQAWAEPHRHYHTLAHLDFVLAAFDGLRHLAPNPDIAELALWLHDVVWEPMRDDCEARSVAWAADHLPVLPALRELPALILETRHLPAAAVSPDAAVVRDADLAILAASEAAYDAYDAAIRAEYAAVPDDEYRRGRAHILTAFAARDPLYFTAPFRAREPVARANLARSLARLGT